MLFLVKSNPEFSSKVLVGAKATLALSLILLPVKRKTIIDFLRIWQMFKNFASSVRATSAGSSIPVATVAMG